MAHPRKYAPDRLARFTAVPRQWAGQVIRPACSANPSNYSSNAQRSIKLPPCIVRGCVRFPAASNAKLKFPIASTTPAIGSVNRFRPVTTDSTVPSGSIVWWIEPVMFKLTVFVGLARFVTVAFRSGEVMIRFPPGSCIVLALPSAEMLIGKVHDPNGAPGSTTNVRFTSSGGVPF